MRYLIVLMLSVLQASPAAAAGSNAPEDLGKTRCESRSTANEVQEIECRLTAANEPQRFVFSARFSGGHDDTMASMILSLNGKPLACGDGSKTRLMGEDGEVSLHCDFAIAQEERAEGLLRVQVKWSHAQYTDFGLAAQRQ